jgi:hypothetical protein
LALGYTRDKVEPAVKLEVWAFPLEEVRLLDGPFRHAMDLDGAYLLSLDTERLVRNFRVNAGLPTQAEPLGGWEAPDCELRGILSVITCRPARRCMRPPATRYLEKGQAVVRVLGNARRSWAGVI